MPNLRLVVVVAMDVLPFIFFFWIRAGFVTLPLVPAMWKYFRCNNRPVTDLSCLNICPEKKLLSPLLFKAYRSSGHHSFIWKPIKTLANFRLPPYHHWIYRSAIIFTWKIAKFLNLLTCLICNGEILSYKPGYLYSPIIVVTIYLIEKNISSLVAAS